MVPSSRGSNRTEHQGPNQPQEEEGRARTRTRRKWKERPRACRWCSTSSIEAGDAGKGSGLWSLLINHSRTKDGRGFWNCSTILGCGFFIGHFLRGSHMYKRYFPSHIFLPCSKYKQPGEAGGRRDTVIFFYSHFRPSFGLGKGRSEWSSQVHREMKTRAGTVHRQ